MRTQNITYILSTQQSISCANAYGCDYGWTESTYDYVKKGGGIEQESDYPFTAYDGKNARCKDNSSNYVATVSHYFVVEADPNATSYPRSVEENMANYVKSKGPLSICLNALSWSTYTGGVMTYCPEASVNHCEFEWVLNL